VIEKLHKEIAAIQDMPDIQKQMQARGAEVVRMGPAEFGGFIASETAKWGRVVREAGIKVE
jgi:tripartite-type tricarboxylate transporter receptor subunit TctC